MEALAETKNGECGDFKGMDIHDVARTRELGTGGVDEFGRLQGEALQGKFNLKGSNFENAFFIVYTQISDSSLEGANLKNASSSYGGIHGTFDSFTFFSEDFCKVKNSELSCFQ